GTGGRSPGKRTPMRNRSAGGCACSTGDCNSGRSAGSAAGAAASLPSRPRYARPCSFVLVLREVADTACVQMQADSVPGLLLKRNHVPPLAFREITVGRQHPDVAAARVHEELQGPAFAGTQLQLFLRDEVRFQ